MKIFTLQSNLYMIKIDSNLCFKNKKRQHQKPVSSISINHDVIVDAGCWIQKAQHCLLLPHQFLVAWFIVAAAIETQATVNHDKG